MAFAVALVVLAAGCSSNGDANDASGGAPGAGGAGPTTPLGVPLGECATVFEQHAIEGASHVEACSEVSYGTNPPSSGSHYATWAAFQSYAIAVPRGYLVHALEHGAVVYGYNCPEGCADEVAAAEAMFDALPDDPRCTPHGLRWRIILTPDPLLDVRWAASAWGATARAECFAADELRAFYVEYGRRGPEDLCNQGIAFGEGSPCP